MSDASEPGQHDDAFWRAFLTNGASRERRLRNVLRMLPSDPRCRLCAGPFTGVGGGLMRLVGKQPSLRNPTVCNSCFDFVSKHHGGAEIEASFLFADVRGSTSLAEGMSATAFRALLDRFYGTASRVVFRNEGSVDKFVGDELVAMFAGFMSGENHAEKAIEAARDLLRSTGHLDPNGPWIPLGAGVDSGPAWIGAVGTEPYVELTALGDTVNTTARLASAATAGEILVTARAADAAHLVGGYERRRLELKGKRAPTDVVSIQVRPTIGAA